MSLPDALAGLFCGVLSGWGLGGGSLLLLYMTRFGGLEQTAAQGINLIYFLPASAAALVSHVKNGLIDRGLALRLALPGMASAAASAFLAASLDPSLLRRLFGIFCVAVGVRMFLEK